MMYNYRRDYYIIVVEKELIIYFNKNYTEET